MVHDDSLKFVNEPIPPEEDIEKRALYAKTLRVHDVMLRRAGEYLGQVASIKDTNIQALGKAVGELANLNEAFLLEFNSRLLGVRKDFEAILTKAVTDIRIDLKKHIASVDQRFADQREKNERDIEARVGEKLSELTDRAAEAVERFDTYKKETESELVKFHGNIASKVGSALTELKKDREKFRLIASKLGE